jgi:hypothetical protein
MEVPGSILGHNIECSDILRNFAQFLLANTGTVPWNRSRPLPSMYFPIQLALLDAIWSELLRALINILQRIDPLLGKDHKQTGSHGIESTCNNRGTVENNVFCGPRRNRCYATAW